MPEVLTQKKGVMCSKFTGGAYADTTEVIEDELKRIGREHLSSSIAVERERLKDAVIEAAKIFTDDKEPRENWDVLAAYRELCRAVDVLLDFESKQK